MGNKKSSAKGEKIWNKQIFHTTQKSDFIHNMTGEGFQRLLGVYLAAAIAVIGLCAVPLAVFCDWEYWTNELGVAHYWSERFMYLSAVALMTAGILGFILLLIALMKKQVKVSKYKGLALLIGYLLLVIVSVITAEDQKIALQGFDGRYEGLLGICSYIGLFCCTVLLSQEKFRLRLMDYLVGVGVLNAIYGILQGIPAFGGTIPSYYDYFNPGGGLKMNTFMASGFVGSPQALAALLTLCIGIAAAGIAYDKNKIRRRLYFVSTLLFVAAGVLTHSLTAYIGLGVAGISLLVFEIIRLARRRAYFKGAVLQNPLGRVVVSYVSYGLVFLLVLVLGLTALTDNLSIWMDSTDRLKITIGQGLNYGKLDVFPKLWADAVDVIKDKWVLGSGPDNYASYQFDGTYVDVYAYTASDRAHNIFLQVAADSGIPAALFFLSFIGLSLVKAFRRAWAFAEKHDQWIAAGIAAALTGYVVQGLFNTSTVTVSPFFWILLGLVWTLPKKENA